MADQINEQDVQTTDEQATETKDSAGEKTSDSANEPSVTELLAQVAQLRTEQAKTKNALDKALREKGEITKQLRAKQTAEEIAEETRQAEAAEREQHVKDLEHQVKMHQATERYLGMGMSKELAENTAEAELNGDMDLVVANCNKNTQAAIKAAQAEWLKSRPPVNSGTGTSGGITQEQFNNMSIAEKTKVRRNDPELYERLKANWR